MRKKVGTGMTRAALLPLGATVTRGTSAKPG